MIFRTHITNARSVYILACTDVHATAITDRAGCILRIGILVVAHFFGNDVMKYVSTVPNITLFMQFLYSCQHKFRCLIVTVYTHTSCMRCEW
jgi:hypothetical protein